MNTYDVFIKNALPSKRTLQKWYEIVDGAQCYTSKALKILKIKARDARKNNTTIVCNLVLDEIYLLNNISNKMHHKNDYTDM